MMMSNYTIGSGYAGCNYAVNPYLSGPSVSPPAQINPFAVAGAGALGTAALAGLGMATGNSKLVKESLVKAGKTADDGHFIGGLKNTARYFKGGLEGVGRGIKNFFKKKDAPQANAITPKSINITSAPEKTLNSGTTVVKDVNGTERKTRVRPSSTPSGDEASSVLKSGHPLPTLKPKQAIQSNAGVETGKTFVKEVNGVQRKVRSRSAS
jgi:hypothetical protein